MPNKCRNYEADPFTAKHMKIAIARLLADSNRYDASPEEFNGFGNLLNSHLVYVADFYRSEV